MENEYIKNVDVGYTNVDKNLKLGLVDLICMIQDTSTEYFGKIGSDNVVVRNESNAAWVIRKMKFHIEKYPTWQEHIKLTSYTSEKTKIRLEVEAKAEDKNNNLLFVGKQEVCPIDLETRKIRKIDTIKYPHDIEVKPTIMENSFEKLEDNFIEDNKVLSVQIHSVDVDFTGHTNNVNYIRYLMNTLDSNFLDNHKITDVEIHYLHESLEGDLLEIYRKDYNDRINFLIERDEEEIVRAEFKIKQIKSDE